MFEFWLCLRWKHSKICALIIDMEIIISLPHPSPCQGWDILTTALSNAFVNRHSAILLELFSNYYLYIICFKKYVNEYSHTYINIFTDYFSTVWSTWKNFQRTRVDIFHNKITYKTYTNLWLLKYIQRSLLWLIPIF